MHKVITVVLALLFIIQFSCQGQNLSKPQKIEITKALIDHIKENYVLQDSVVSIISEITERYKMEEFSKEQDHQAFALYLTQVLRQITQDAHFGFLYNPQLAALLSDPNGADNAALNRQLGSFAGPSIPLSKKNFFFKKAEILDGNIAYLKLEQMAMLDESKATLDAAMAFLAHCDAFILDVRDNRGGAGGFIPYLMSYFFPNEKVLLYRREMPAPAWDSISYHYTHLNLPGRRFENIPLFILTNQVTGSAATNLAYTMQSFGKAVIVGENTGSGFKGAHSASLFGLPYGLVSLIPIGKVVNAQTKTNWRNEGVQPDIKTKSSEALTTAHKQALEQLIKRESVEDIKEYLKNIYKELSHTKSEEKVLKTAELYSQYIGSYEGGRTIWVEDNQLKYKREGGSPLYLKFEKEHLYKITLPSNTRTSQPLPSVKFYFGPKGHVEHIKLVFEDGKNTQGPFKRLNN